MDLIERDERFEVVGATASGIDFLRIHDQMRVDIAVIGWCLSDCTASDVLDELNRRKSKTRIIVYAGATDPKVLQWAMRLGAWAFVSKSEDPDCLLETIAVVARGRLCLPYHSSTGLLNNPADELTRRERELANAITRGLTNQEIASYLGISPNTVKYHLKNLYEKLGASNRVMAAAIFQSMPKGLNLALQADPD